MASTTDNPTMAESGRYHDVAAAGSKGAAGQLDTSLRRDAPGQDIESLRRLIAEGENSGRARDWAVYDFLDRMAEKRRNAGK